ncbi:MAG: hypothetical protein ACI31G_04470 [Bacilli bacterium]
MNQASRYIFELYYYLLNFRDTLEFVLPKDHSKKIYDQRKAVIENGIKENTPLGQFLLQNKENGEKIKENINNVLTDLYAEDSTVLVPNGDLIRVDHTQHLKIYQSIIGLAEQLRDIVYGYINFARGRNELEESIFDLVKKDEVLYRTIVVMLIMRDFEKSFGEFQKVMSENGGKPSPQSNFIVQNEISIMSNLIRFSRQHTHATDNTTLDLLDKVNQVIEMAEGRRDRRNNKSFKELFDEINTDISKYLSSVESLWKNAYDKVLKEVIEFQNSNKKENENLKTFDSNANEA